jgi:hypothetical protein
MRRHTRLAFAAILATTAMSLAFAYSLDGARWNGGTTTFHVNISGTAPSGQSWTDGFRDAMAQWSSQTAFNFVANDSYVDPCLGYSRNDSAGGKGFPSGDGDTHNSAGFRSNVCGNEFGSNVLAITLTYSGAGTLGFPRIMQSDIIFNDQKNWDIYRGPLRSSIDFGRVVLHELGHALGLNHEATLQAIMAPTIGNLDSLQADDIAGANALYQPGTECHIADLPLNAARHNSLAAGDCRVFDLFQGGDDTSYVDAYRIQLDQSTTLALQMHSTALDAVLIITDTSLGALEIFDDSDGTCNVNETVTLPAGEYYLLANTYVVPEKCGGNEGDYTLTITDTGLPVLGAVRNAGGTPLLADTLIVGGATSDAGSTYRSTFAANEAIDVLGMIAPDPEHVGAKGSLYVLVTLQDGRRFMKDSTGKFVLFPPGTLPFIPLRSGTLGTREILSIASGLRGTTSGLAGQTLTVHLGYALDSNPSNLWYGSSPIRIEIGAQ